MASQTLSLGNTFPDGTTVGAYPASAWSEQFATGTPLGAATNSQSVTNGSVTFTGLAVDTDYYAAGSVSGIYRYVRFHTPPNATNTELDYAEITTNATRASTTAADVAGLSVTVTVGTRPIEVRFSCGSAFNNAASGGVSALILEDGVQIGATGNFLGTANNSTPLTRSIRRAPSAGSHTYKVQLKAVFSGTATLSADDGTSGNGPTSIQVIEI